MARTPRAKVSKTSGQGISRLSYQRGRSLGGNIGSVKAPKLEDSSASSGGGGSSSGNSRDYSKADTVEGFNVSYGETFHPTDLKDIEGTLKEAPPKGLNLTPTKSKSFKK